MATSIEGAHLRAAMSAVLPLLDDPNASVPRPDLAAAVRLSVRKLAELAPGQAVEVRVPPFVAVQCVAGPRHTRGTPPNVVETTPRVWLQMATGALTLGAAIAAGQVSASGSRATDIAQYLPIVQKL